MCWVVDLGSERGRRWIVLGAAVLAGLAGLVLFHSIVFAALGFLAVAGSTTDAIFPLRYRIDERAASVRCGWSTAEIEWSKVRRVVADADGVKLSPLPEGSRLDPFRGVYLRFASNKPEVLAKISALWNSGDAPLGKGTDGGGNPGLGRPAFEPSAQEEAGDASDHDA